MAKAAADNQELPGDLMTLKAVSQLDRLLANQPFKTLMQKPEFAAKVKEMDGLVYDISQHYKNFRPEQAQQLIETRIPEMLARLDEHLKINEDSMVERVFSGKYWPYSSGSWSEYILRHMCNHHDMSHDKETGVIRVHGIRGLMLCYPELRPLVDNAEFQYAAEKILRFGSDASNEDIAADPGYFAAEGEQFTGAFGSLHQIAADHNVPKEAVDRFMQAVEDWANQNYKSELQEEAIRQQYRR